jgi:hypothetical protein
VGLFGAQPMLVLVCQLQCITAQSQSLKQHPLTVLATHKMLSAKS